jgi:hypothetical protein
MSAHEVRRRFRLSYATVWAWLVDLGFMCASALVLRGIIDPEATESIACIEGMALAADLRLDSFRLANDCLNVMKSIR